MLRENGACFSTVVCPPVFSDEVPVHGISNEEFRQGPSLVGAFPRMHRFCANLVDMALADTDASGDEVTVGTRREDPPKIVVCAHNGIRLGFPFLCSECIRNDIDIGCLNKWFSPIHWSCSGPLMQARTAAAQSSNACCGTADPLLISMPTALPMMRWHGCQGGRAVCGREGLEAHQL